MNERTKYLAGFFGACFLGAIVMMASVFYVGKIPELRWVPLLVWLALFGFIFIWVRRFRGRLPKPTTKQLSRAAKANRRLGWIYLIGLIFGCITNGEEIIRLPHGIGFLIPIIPIALATYHFRQSARLAQ
jgi:hypothetical protein